MALVRIHNSYSDGHESTVRVAVEDPTGDLNDWWDAVVWPLTGDGHGIDTGADACYEATIEGADDEALIGQTYEWC